MDHIGPVIDGFLVFGGSCAQHALNLFKVFGSSCQWLWLSKKGAIGQQKVTVNPTEEPGPERMLFGMKQAKHTHS